MASGDLPRNLHIRLLPIVLALIAGAFVMARGCQEGPFGRAQVVSLTPDQEAQLGAQAFQQVLRDAEVVPDGPIVDAIEHLGKRLAQASSSEVVVQHLRLLPQSFDWEFRVVRSKHVNAFCLPGGKVVVYTGILSVAQSEAGLATVMGHEIGHALAHHSAERMAQQQLVQIGQTAITQSIDQLPPAHQREVYALLGVGSRFGITLPFSRKHESEADHIGLILMAAAGYDPHEAVTFWQRMEESANAGRPPEFTSTHPSHQHRIRDLETWSGEAAPIYEKSERQKNRKIVLKHSS